MLTQPRYTVVQQWVYIIPLLSTLYLAGAKDAQIVLDPTTALDSDIATSTVDFSSALYVADSIVPELALNIFNNPVPIPKDAPDYEQIRLIASLFPPRPVVVVEPGLNAFANIQSPSNSINEAQKQQNTMRVMIVGDSMTHCREGDYTWRYRIWEWFHSQNVGVKMVGPYLGTLQPDTPGPPPVPPLYGSKTPEAPLQVNGTYAAPFDSHHFAISGRPAAIVQGQIQQVSAQYPSDLMLVMLGFNDFAWLGSDDKGLVASMTNLITNARRSNPNTTFVIGTVPQRAFTPGRPDLVSNTDSYNRILRTQGPGWSTIISPVVVAPVEEEYDCGPQYSPDCPAAYDGLHPNELGEYQIARAYSLALVNGLEIGTTPLAVPASIPTRPLPIPQNFQMNPSPLGLTATWDEVYGAYAYDVDYNINGGAFSPGSTPANRWDSQWAVDGWVYQIRIRATAGNRKGDWTEWVSGTARPQTASTTNAVAHATATGFDVSWDPPSGNYSDSVFLHNVYYWDIDTPGTFLASGAFEGDSGHIDDLSPGHRYGIAVEAWNDAGAGFPAVAESVVVGGGRLEL